MPNVIVYWRPMCGYCQTLKEGLAERGVPFEAVDIWHDRSQAEVVQEANGGDKVVPTVKVGGRFLVNPSVEEVVANTTA